VAFTERLSAYRRRGSSGNGWSGTVFSCDYNGWADVPEEEREGIEAYESAREIVPFPPLPLPPRSVALRRPALPERGLPQRRAA
jgi:hypothetical protein